MDRAGAPSRAMQGSRSAPQLLETRSSSYGKTTLGAIPGYTGHVPASRVENLEFTTFKKCNQACRDYRQIPGYDAQALDRTRADSSLPRARTPPCAPRFDARGLTFPAAGDCQFSRIPVKGEVRNSLHKSLGTLSRTWDGHGGADKLKGMSSVAVAIPGFTGHVPGNKAENVFGDGWSKNMESSLAAHLLSRSRAPKVRSYITKERTFVPALESDNGQELPILNPSYQDHARGWSGCEYTGSKVDPAGRVGPRCRQESYRLEAPPPWRAAIGYTGFIPGRIGENIIGERQRATDDISRTLTEKNRVRVLQR